MAPKLFMIEGFCFSRISRMICVDTDLGQRFISKPKFEKWVDDRDKRLDSEGNIIPWDLYYVDYADPDLYEYIVIRMGSQIFKDIKTALDECLN